MVVQGLLALALALPTGMLFGVGYGNGVRIGYEQIYPLLFPKTDTRPNPAQTAENMKAINKIYDLVGGKEASQMGIAQGITAAGELLHNPDFQVLEELELRLSSRTLLSSGLQESRDKTSSVLEESFLSDLDFNQTDEYITDFIQRIKETTDRSRLISWRQFLEGNSPYNKENTNNLLKLINIQLESNSKEGTGVSEKFVTDFKKLLTALPTSDMTSMYVNRGKFQTWQIPLIIAEHKIRQLFPDAEVSVYQQKRRDYRQGRDKLLKTLKEMKEAVVHLKTVGGNAGGIARWSKIHAAARKELQNFITQGRNDINTKSLANNDWNKRIWKTYDIPE